MIQALLQVSSRVFFCQKLCFPLNEIGQTSVFLRIKRL